MANNQYIQMSTSNTTAPSSTGQIGYIYRGRILLTNITITNNTNTTLTNYTIPYDGIYMFQYTFTITNSAVLPVTINSGNVYIVTGTSINIQTNQIIPQTVSSGGYITFSGSGFISTFFQSTKAMKITITINSPTVPGSQFTITGTTFDFMRIA